MRERSGGVGSNVYEIIIRAKDESQDAFSGASDSIKRVSDDIKDKAIPSFDGLKSSAQSASDAISKLSSDAAALATSGVNTIGESFEGTAKAAIDAGKSIKTLNRAFKASTGGGITEFLGSINEELEDLADNSVVGTVKVLTEFFEISTKRADDFKNISETLEDVSETLADSNESVKELTDQDSGATSFLKQVDDRLKSVKGRLEQAGDSLAIFGGDVARKLSPVADTVGSLRDRAIDFGNSVTQYAGEATSQVSQIATSAFDSITPQIELVTAKAEELSGTVSGLGDRVRAGLSRVPSSASEVSSALDKVQQATTASVESITSRISSIGDSISDKLPERFSDLSINIGEVREQTEKLSARGIQVFRRLPDLIEQAGDRAKELAGRLQQGVGNRLPSGLVDRASQLIPESPVATATEGISELRRTGASLADDISALARRVAKDLEGTGGSFVEFAKSASSNIEQFALDSFSSVSELATNVASRAVELAASFLNSEDVSAPVQGADQSTQAIAGVGDAADSAQSSVSGLSSAAQATGDALASVGDVADETASKVEGGLIQSLSSLDSTLSRIVRTTGRVTKGIQTFGNATGDGLIALSGVRIGVSLFEELQGAIGPAAQGIASVAANISFFADAMNILQPLVASGPYQLLIGQVSELNSQLLATQSSLAATNQIFSGGNQITDAFSAIESLGPPIQKAIADIREGSLELVGVTSSQLIEQFQIIAGQAANIGASLQDAADLTLSFSASLGTLGIPLFQARQEISSILTGTIDMNSVLAKSIGLTNELVRKFQENGTLVEELTKRLESFRAGNALAAQSISGVASNIQEIFENIGLAAGQGLIAPIVERLNNVYEYLEENRDDITEFVRDISSRVLASAGKVADALGDVFQKSEVAIYNAARLILEGIVQALDGLAIAIRIASRAAEPFLAIISQLAQFSGILNILFTAGLTLKALAASVGTVTRLAGAFADGIAGVGEWMFLLDVRSSALAQTFLGLNSQFGIGISSAFTLGQNLDKIPGAIDAIADRIPIIGDVLAPMIPQIAAAGSGVLLLLNRFPALKGVLFNAGGAASVAAEQFAAFAKTNLILAPLAPNLENLAQKSKILGDSVSLTNEVNRQFGLIISRVRGQVLKTVGRFGLYAVIVAGAANAINEFILKNEGLMQVIEDVGEVLADIGEKVINFLSNPFASATVAALGFVVALQQGLVSDLVSLAKRFGEVPFKEFVEGMKAGGSGLSRLSSTLLNTEIDLKAFTKAQWQSIKAILASIKATIKNAVAQARAAIASKFLTKQNAVTATSFNAVTASTAGASAGITAFSVTGRASLVAFAKTAAATLGPLVLLGAAIVTFSETFSLVAKATRSSQAAINDYNEALEESRDKLELLRDAQSQLEDGDDRSGFERRRDEIEEESNFFVKSMDRIRAVLLAIPNLVISQISKVFPGYDAFVGDIIQGIDNIANSVLGLLGAELNLGATWADVFANKEIQDHAAILGSIGETYDQIAADRENAVRDEQRLSDLQARQAALRLEGNESAARALQGEVDTLKERISARKEALDQEISALKELKVTGDTNVATQKSYIKLLEDQRRILDDIAEFEIRPPNLVRLGSAFEQLTKKADGAFQKVQSMIDAGSGQNEQFQAQASQVVDLTQQVAEQGIVSADTAIERLEVIANAATVEADTQLKAQQAITAIRQAEGERQLSIVQRQQTEIERLRAGGGIGERQALQLEGEAQQAELDKQFENLEQYYADRRAIREAAVDDVSKELADLQGQYDAGGEEIRQAAQQRLAAFEAQRQAISENAEIDRESTNLKNEAERAAFEEREELRAEAIADVEAKIKREQDLVVANSAQQRQILSDQIDQLSQQRDDAVSAAEEQELRDREEQLNKLADLETKQAKLIANNRLQEIELGSELAINQLEGEQAQIELLREQGLATQADLEIAATETELAQIQVRLDALNDRYVAESELRSQAIATAQAQLETAEGEERQRLLRQIEALQETQLSADEKLIGERAQLQAEAAKKAREAAVRELEREQQAALDVINEVNKQTEIDRLRLQRRGFVRESSLNRERAQDRQRTANAELALEQQKFNQLLALGNANEEAIRESRQRILELTEEALSAERALVEAYIADVQEALAEEARAYGLELQEQNAEIERQIALSDSLNRALDGRQRLLEASNSLRSAGNNFIIGELDAVASLERSEFRRRQFAQVTAALKLEALTQEQRIERELFELEQERQRLALERRSRENEQQINNLQADIAQGQAEVEAANQRYQAGLISGLERDEVIQEQERRVLDLQRALSERDFISQEGAIQQREQAIQARQLEFQQQSARTQAAVDFAQTLSPGAARNQVVESIQQSVASRFGSDNINDVRRSLQDRVTDTDYIESLLAGRGGGILEETLPGVQDSAGRAEGLAGKIESSTPQTVEEFEQRFGGEAAQITTEIGDRFSAVTAELAANQPNREQMDLLLGMLDQAAILSTDPAQSLGLLNQRLSAEQADFVTRQLAGVGISSSNPGGAPLQAIVAPGQIPVAAASRALPQSSSPGAQVGEGAFSPSVNVTIEGNASEQTVEQIRQISQEQLDDTLRQTELVLGPSIFD